MQPLTASRTLFQSSILLKLPTLNIRKKSEDKGEKEEARVHFQDFPYEVFIFILGFIPSHQLLPVGVVCRSWYNEVRIILDTVPVATFTFSDQLPGVICLYNTEKKLASRSSYLSGETIKEVFHKENDNPKVYVRDYVYTDAVLPHALGFGNFLEVRGVKYRLVEDSCQESLNIIDYDTKANWLIEIPVGTGFESSEKLLQALMFHCGKRPICYYKNGKCFNINYLYQQVQYDTKIPTGLKKQPYLVRFGRRAKRVLMRKHVKKALKGLNKMSLKKTNK